MLRDKDGDLFLGTDYPPAISMGVNVNSLKSHAACRRPAMSSGTLAKSGVLRFDYRIVDAAPAIKRSPAGNHASPARMFVVCRPRVL